MPELNARNLLCPLPVIRVQDAIKTLLPKQQLTVFCTDPGVKYDIPAWCKMRGHTVLSIEEVERDIIVTIEVGEEI
ncbi:MAG: sulfurtransferase TusA family protein [Gammaproteobacteria bacterium]|nr:sulfurtransferase TusA family protein [Gammaproteobacteria bacterium]